jgi:hypothetical protein
MPRKARARPRCPTGMARRAAHQTDPGLRLTGPAGAARPLPGALALAEERATSLAPIGRASAARGRRRREIPDALRWTGRPNASGHPAPTSPIEVEEVYPNTGNGSKSAPSRPCVSG